MSAVLPTPSAPVLPSPRRLALRLVLAVGVLALLAGALASLPGLEEIRRRLGDAVPGWIAVCLALQAGSCLAFVVAYRGVLSRRLAWGASYEVGMAVQGASVLAGAVGYMALDMAALAAAFAAVGAVPPVGVFALAYVLGQLGGVLPMPGGVGGADGGLIAALALYGTPLAETVAAVLAYRIFQFGLPALLGTVALVRLPRVVPRLGEAPRSLGPSVPRALAG